MLRFYFLGGVLFRIRFFVQLKQNFEEKTYVFSILGYRWKLVCFIMAGFASMKKIVLSTDINEYLT